MWIDYEPGTGCPVAPGTPIRIRVDYAVEFECTQPQFIDWDFCDTIQYKFLQPELCLND